MASGKRNFLGALITAPTGSSSASLRRPFFCCFLIPLDDTSYVLLPEVTEGAEDAGVMGGH